MRAFLVRQVGPDKQPNLKVGSIARKKITKMLLQTRNVPDSVLDYISALYSTAGGKAIAMRDDDLR